MKKIFVIMAAGVIILAACSNERGRYVDLRTGERVELEKDEQSGRMVNAETNKPVYIYVDTRNNDTIYGRTGEVINGHVVKMNDMYWYEMDEEYKVKYDDGEYKLKHDDYKYKVDDDGDIKIKTDDQKTKIDGETGEKKVKND
jgi:hypothetical protein